MVDIQQLAIRIGGFPMGMSRDDIHDHLIADGIEEEEFQLAWIFFEMMPPPARAAESRPEQKG